MASFDMQHRIRQNAQKMQDTMSDLYDWEKDMTAKDEKLGGAGTGKNAAKKAGGAKKKAAAPVRNAAPSPKAKTMKPGEMPDDMMDSLRAVKRRHEEREATIAAEEAARLPGGGGQTAERKDWKSGNMQDYYRKWDTFDEDEADKQVEASQKKAAAPAKKKAPKVQAKLGPAGIGGAADAAADAAPIPKPQQLPRGLAQNIAALDDATLNGAAREKDKGNSLFKEKRFGEAVAAYTRGLDVCYGKGSAECADTTQLSALKATLYCNRSMAHLKLENWELADADADSALDLDGAMVKAYLRRGTARRAQHRYADATRDFERVLQIDPSNKDGIKQLPKTMALLKKFGGSKAVSGGAKKGTGKGKGKKGGGGLVLAFEKQSKAAARKAEEPWRVQIPIRTVEGVAEVEPEPEAAPVGPSMRPASAPASPGASMTPRDSSEIAAVRAAATARATAAAAMGTPRTGYELERGLKALGGTPERLVRWLLGLEPPTVAALLKSILTAETLLSMVEPLAAFDTFGIEDDDPDAAWRILALLHAVATVPRFGMTVQFLSKAEQCTVSTLFEKLTIAAAADGGGWDAERRKVLESARGSFGLVKKSL